jgi:hypothetical protein
MMSDPPCVAPADDDMDRVVALEGMCIAVEVAVGVLRQRKSASGGTRGPSRLSTLPGPGMCRRRTLRSTHWRMAAFKPTFLPPTS